jgi:hypothetical protein
MAPMLLTIAAAKRIQCDSMIDESDNANPYAPSSTQHEPVNGKLRANWSADVAWCLLPFAVVVIAPVIIFVVLVIVGFIVMWSD